jgi:[ribosomal protein S18]-alanine N-acetyltransferase
MDEFTLRACRYQDLGEILTVEKAAFPDSPYSWFDFVYFLTRPGVGFTVALMGERLVGYVVSMGTSDNGMIQSIAVSPGFRRRSIGAALMKSALEHLSEYKRIYLLVERNNIAAISLYHRFSFKETGKVKRGYYKNGNDAIEMVQQDSG